MDIISHTITGLASGTVLANISDETWKRKILIFFAGAFGGALPDFDAISLWSKFNGTIGKFFNLSHSGKEIYFGKFWYSHRAFLHSILAPIIFIGIFVLLSSVLRKNFSFKKNLKSNKFLYLAFFFGSIFHSFEDMLTPASVWKGVNFLFPSSNYTGGFGKIWWWNNYDLFLIIVSVAILNLIINFLPKKIYILKVALSIFIFSLGLSLYMFQINTRVINFSYEGFSPKYNKFEKQSKLIQKEILGDKLYKIMSEIDSKIPFYF